MTDLSPFDGRPDPGLGAELRAALEGPGAEAFLVRLRAAVAALLWLLIGLPEPAAPAGPIASAPVQMEVSPGQPEAVVLTVALLEGR